MRRTILTLILALFATIFLGGCSSTAPALLRSQSIAALADFQHADSSLDILLKSSYGYAIFPRVTTGALVVGGSHGDGEVYQAGKFQGTAEVSQGSIGVQAGGQRFAELVLFRTESRYLDFTHNTWEFDARASAIAAANGKAATADYSKGVLVFTLPEGGLMAQAAVGVQKFSFHKQNP